MMSLGFLMVQFLKLHDHIVNHTQLDTVIEKNGLTLRSELQNLSDMSDGAIHDERLDHESFPPLFNKSLRYFRDLSKCRKNIDPISYTEINAYVQLKNIELTSLELKAINTIDDAYVVGMKVVHQEIQNRATK